MRLDDTIRARLHTIIPDRAAADAFIRAAQGAIDAYQIMRHLPPTNSDRRKLKSLQAAARRYAKLLDVLTPQDCCDIACGSALAGGTVIDDAALNGAQQNAYAVADAVGGILQDMTPRRGRRMDGKGIILIQSLAKAFPGRISAGDRSRFVRAVEILNDIQPLGFSDIRQKVRDTLRVIKLPKAAK